jgi:hypothetical protein
MLSDLGKTLESERNHLLKRIEMDEVKLRKLQDEVEAQRQVVLKKKEGMGKYSALFMHPKRNKKTDRMQRMGRQNAVMQTKRIIEAQIEHVKFEYESLDVKFNRALGRNMDLRRKIDLLRRERVIYRKLFTKLERELKDIKKQIGQENETIERLYEQRDMAQMDMVDLKQEMEHTQAEIRREWDLLNQVIQVARDKETVNSGEVEDVTVGLLTPEEEEQLKQSVRKGMWALGKGKVQLKAHKARIMEHEEIWNRISKGTGHGSVEELVNAFKTAEERKYNKVAAASLLTTEIEGLEMELKDLYKHLKSRKGIMGGGDKDAQRSAQAEALKQRVDKTETALKQQQAENATARKLLEALMDPVMALFTRLGCDRLVGSGGDEEGIVVATTDADPDDGAPRPFFDAAVRQSINSGLSINNVEDFISVIEARARYMVQQYAAVTSMSARPTSSTLGPLAPPGKMRELIQSSALTVAAADDVFGLAAKDGDIEDRPLSRGEMLRRAAMQLQADAFKATKSASLAAVQVLASQDQHGAYGTAAQFMASGNSKHEP